jgi:thiamine biosynthesis lipoprotein ApbE
MQRKKLPIEMLIAVAALSTSPALAAPVAAPVAPVQSASALPVDVPVESGQVEEVRTIFGKTCSVRVHGGDATAAKAATGRALAEIARVLTNYVQPSKTSELHSINANAGGVHVAVRFAFEFYETGGVFASSAITPMHLDRYNGHNK